jgi:hypothetical protein
MNIKLIFVKLSSFCPVLREWLTYLLLEPIISFRLRIKANQKIHDGQKSGSASAKCGSDKITKFPQLTYLHGMHSLRS